MKHKSYLILFCCLWIVSTLSGCNRREEYKDLDAYVAELRREEMKKHLKPSNIAEINIPPNTTYQAKGLRAPFETNATKSIVKGVSADPLQRYPINMLRFVGTLTKSGRLYAYILAPDGMLYEVKQGDLIGDRYGKVSSIEPKQMTIMEEEAGKRSMQTMRLREGQ